MKKNFFKKLALVMALTVTATSVPAFNASAAAAPGFKSSSVSVKIGQSKKYSTANSSSYSVKFKIGNTKIATIQSTAGSKSVKVTGVAEGKSTLRADFKSYKTKKTVTQRIPVNVISDGLKGVVQESTTKLTATISGNTGDVKVSDFSLVRKEDKVVVPIKGTSVSKADTTKVTVEVFSSLKDGKEYTLTYAGKTADFKVTDGVATQLAISPQTVEIESETEINVLLKDVNGVEIGSYNLENYSNNSKLEFSVSVVDGYVSGKNLRINGIGSVANAKATLHTFEYDENGKEKNVITVESTITGVPKGSITVESTKYTIADKAPDWNKTVNVNTRLSVGDSNYKAYLNIKTATGKDIDYSKYVATSSDENVLIVGGIDVDTKAVELLGVKEGSAYILIKDATSNAVVATLQVNVTSARKDISLILGATSATLSNAPKINDSKEVTVKLRDQYGTDKDVEVTNIDVECTRKPASVTDITPYYTRSKGKVVFNAANLVPGSYSYQIKVGSFTRVVTISIVAPTSAATTYKLNIDKTKDLTFEGNTIKVNLSVGMYKSSALFDRATISSITVRKDGKSVLTTGSAVTTTGSAIDLGESDNNKATITLAEADSNNKVMKEAAGNYTVTVNYVRDDTKTYTVTDTFVVTDKQTTEKSVSIEVKKLVDTNAGNLEAFLSNQDNFVVSVDGDKLELVDGQTLAPLGSEEKKLNNGKQSYIGKITVYRKQTYNGVEYLIPYTVNVGKTFTYLS